jgi:hypothetical protein
MSKSLTRRRVLQTAAAGALTAREALGAPLSGGIGPASSPPAGTTIIGITLSNNTFTSSSPSGTVVGAISVQTSGGAFTGSLSVTGTDASSFQIVGNNLETQGTPGAGTYSINIVATQGGATGSPFTQAETITGSALPALTATLTFPGGTPAGGPFVFDIASGTDMGSYTAPSGGFAQRCIRVRHASIPHFLVDFRPDTAGGRIEVVFWYGECSPGNTANVPSGYNPSPLAAYTCVVKNAGTPVADFMSVSTRSIPYHYWGARWRFRTVQNRTLVRTASQIFSQGWLPHMSLQAARLSGTNVSTGQAWSGQPYSHVPGSIIIPPAPPLLNSSNMGFIGASTPFNTNANGPIYEPFMQSTTNDLSGVIVGVNAYQDAGGQKKEEGLISEWQADWLLNGTASSLNTMLQQAEMASSQMNSWYLPDAGTGACPEFKQDLAHYKSGTGSAAGFADGTWYGIPAADTPSPGGTLVCNLNGSHLEGGWAYLQFVLTEDPYFLEFLQYSTMGIVGYDAPSRNGDSSARANVGNLVGDATGQTGLNGPFTIWSYPREVRNLGWGVKNVAQSWKCSPASPPSWLLSQATYAAYSSDFSVCGKRVILDSTDDMNAVFKYYMNMNPGAAPTSPTNPWADYYQNFEQCYTTMGIALAAFLGLPVPQVAGQIVPPAWSVHAKFCLDMLSGQFVATNTTDQFSTAGWNRQCPLIHDLAGTMISTRFAHDAGAGVGAVCPTSTTTSDNILSFYGFHCLPSTSTFAALWTLYGPATTSTATFPAAAFPGNQQGASMANVNWQMAAAAMCKSAGVDTTNAQKVMDYLNLFIDYNWPNNADGQLGIAMYARAGFDGT